MSRHKRYKSPPSHPYAHADGSGGDRLSKGPRSDGNGDISRHDSPPAGEDRASQLRPITQPNTVMAPITEPHPTVTVPLTTIRTEVAAETPPLALPGGSGAPTTFIAPDTQVLPIVTPTKSRQDDATGGFAQLRGGSLGRREIVTDSDSPQNYTPENGVTGGSVRHSEASGNGMARARVAPSSPTLVKVRVGNRNAYTSGNGHYSENGNGNGNENGHDGVPKARVASLGGTTVKMAAPRPVTTAHLRAADLTDMRYRLKTAQSTSLPPSLARQRTRRPLPYFLMRHRNMRARTRVGHIRTQASLRKFGKGGALGVVVKLGLVFFLLWGLVTTAITSAGIAGATWFLNQLPPIDPVNFSKAISVNGINVQTTKIYDRNGTLLYDLVDEATGRREELTLDEISPLVISATIAAEDATFYTNPGIDVRGIGRAILINLSKQGQSGGSTITQQLVRQVLLTQEERVKGLSSGIDGFARKIKEAVLAVEITRRYSKDFILQTFLNQNPYGHRAYGIGAAARVYFNKAAKDLTLPEAALLAGLPQAPTAYDPLINPDQAKIRQAIVLDLMVKQDMITPEEASAAKDVNIGNLNPYKVDIKAPHFVYYVRDYLEKKYGADFARLGLQVYTTLDLNVQAAAEQVAKDRIEQIRQQKATNAAIVVMKPGTGEILAMVGSVDYNDTSIDGQVNVATAERQPGSSFKPITYATAFKKGWSPGTVILDTQTQFPSGGSQPPYVPKNYDGRDHGWVTVRESIGNSYNIPAVKALQFAGIQETIDTAHAMGIQGLNKGLSYYGLSLTLGGGEVTLLDMTTAYSTFANGGKAVAANPILRIVDPQNRIVEQIDPNNVPGNQALDPRIAYMITNILSDNRARSSAFGVNNPLRLDFPAAAKTGTTDNNKDSWTLGYTPSLTVGVWVGNSNGAVMQAVTGAIGAAVIWNKMMTTFYANNKFLEILKKPNPDGSFQKLQTDFIQPDGLVRMTACSNKGAITDLFLVENKPKGCINYKDPNVNVQTRNSSPDRGTTRPAPRTQSTPQVQQPRSRPTPIPGILPPSFP